MYQGAQFVLNGPELDETQIIAAPTRLGDFPHYGRLDQSLLIELYAQQFNELISATPRPFHEALEARRRDGIADFNEIRSRSAEDTFLTAFDKRMNACLDRHETLVERGILEP